METRSGKRRIILDALSFADRLRGYQDVLIDLGTGDGRFVRSIAAQSPTLFAIGVDSCREQLDESSRRAPANALYLIANAANLPAQLQGRASWITINFPWGSLLRGLLDTADGCVPAGLRQIARPAARLDLLLNAGALAEAGWSLEAGSRRVVTILAQTGWQTIHTAPLDRDALHAYPTTWARRLAFGRDQRAIWVRATRACWPEARDHSLTSGTASLSAHP